jgi:hypothetical protein
MAAGDKLTTAASVERVNDWKRHHVAVLARPSFTLVGNELDLVRETPA